MTEQPYEFVTTAEGPVLRVRARGSSVPALAELPLDDPIQQVHQAMWQPEYARVEPV